MRRRIIIIGAGMTALSCADRLRRHRLTDVLILEAQRYVGGRTKSLSIGGIVAEYGAEFIHGEHAITQKYCREFGLATQEWVAPEGVDGRLFAGDEGIRDDSSQILGQLRTIKEQIYDYQGGSNTLAGYLDSLDIPDIVKYYLARNIGDVEACDPSNLGVPEFIAAGNMWSSGKRNFFIKQGYGALVGHLSDGLDIITDCAVASIDTQHSSPVRLTTTDGRHYEADKVILTVPLGVLKSDKITFTPNPPESFRSSVDKIGFGNSTKLIMIFDDPVPRFRMLDTGGLFGHFWQRDCDDRVVITGFSGGSRADQLSKLTESDAIRYGLDELSTGLGQGIRDQLVYAEHATWSDNPWVAGSYSYPTPGIGDARSALLPPLTPDMIYAGEATNINGHHATVHGAIEEGLRAANWVIKGKR